MLLQWLELNNNGALCFLACQDRKTETTRSWVEEIGRSVGVDR